MQDHLSQRNARIDSDSDAFQIEMRPTDDNDGNTNYNTDCNHFNVDNIQLINLFQKPSVYTFYTILLLLLPHVFKVLQDWGSVSTIGKFKKHSTPKVA